MAVHLALLWLVCGRAYYLSLGRGTDCVGAALVTMAAALLVTYSFGPRMFYSGWLCLVGLILVLDRFQRTGKGLWPVPPILALWINWHASSVFGFVVLGICSWWSFTRERQ